MNPEIKKEALQSIEGLLKLDKTELIYHLLKLQNATHWLMQRPEAHEIFPGKTITWLKSFAIWIYKAVGHDTADHAFVRFIDTTYYCCSQCGLWSTRPELPEDNRIPYPHAKGCTGSLCDYKMTMQDFAAGA